MSVKTFVNKGINDSIFHPAWALLGTVGFGLLDLPCLIGIQALVWHVYLWYRIGLKPTLVCTPIHPPPT